MEPYENKMESYFLKEKPKQEEKNITVLFDLLKKGKDEILLSNIVKILKNEGLDVESDPRLEDFKNLFKDSKDPSICDVSLSPQAFQELVKKNEDLLVRALLQTLVIQNFEDFTKKVEKIYQSIKLITEGKVSTHIPEMKKVSTDLWGISICSVDGQILNIGDWKEPFTIQSCNKPFMYGLALETLGCQFIHLYTGYEPTNKKHDALLLDRNKKPHNALVNIGAIVICGLIQNNALPKMTVSAKHEYISTILKDLSGGKYVQFKNSVYISEKESGYQNKALAYYLESKGCFPQGCDVEQALDLYFTSCSMEVNSESLSVMAATLANGGICPITKMKIFRQETVKNILSLMRTGGMYNYSGEFAFLVGLPAKGCASGGVLLVVPGILGVGLFSPTLDSNGNSVRGVRFCEAFVEEFKFHPFYDVRLDIKRSKAVMKLPNMKCMRSCGLFNAAAKGDVQELSRLLQNGADMEARDCNNHNALHVAASSNQIESAKFFFKNCKELFFSRDDWDRTPLDYARKLGHKEMTIFLEERLERNDAWWNPSHTTLEYDEKNDDSITMIPIDREL